MSIYYDASEKGAERRAREWRAEGEKVMEGNREFYRWRLWNYCLFGALALLVFFGFFNFIKVVVERGGLPPNDQWTGRWGGVVLAGWVFAIGQRRYTKRCRKIALAAELEKLRAKKDSPGPTSNL